MASRAAEEEEEASLTFQEIVLSPFRIIFSREVLRVVFNSAILLITGLVLLAAAATVYILFYNSYIPIQGFTRAVHLQFDPTNHHHPFGVVPIGHDVVTAQPYDVHVALNLPRTPENRGAGNFMLDLRLHGPSTSKVSAAVMEAVMGDAAPEVLAHARRPAILTYYTPTLESIRNAIRLPAYLSGWGRDAEVLKISLMEGVVFPRGWKNIPATARLELHSDTKLQVYAASLIFRARFGGLRYLMYNYRLTCFVLFTLVFWAAEVTAVIFFWAILSYLVFPSKSTGRAKIEAKEEDSESGIKAEPGGAAEEDLSEGLSETERTFPTYSRQPPLRYISPAVKEEAEKKDEHGELPAAAVEADDEDEDADFIADDPRPIRGLHSDSGLGTSMESSAARRESVRRRRSGGSGGSGGSGVTDFHDT
ncbi:hypothetical protein NA57DRAFT_77396 [Rhizodiscina lignyota]|uniref:Seipin n=1 Tax=Rhizodiscina lignyota TaxID=1504668 RepID=A0A9P4IF95_9PEZI|nr:hypothetical protein NA57DRAFT_77396 [Rhizodiscina lignyota]